MSPFSPATTAILLRAMEAEVHEREMAHSRAAHAFGYHDEVLSRAHGKRAAKLRVEREPLRATAQAAEEALREARWALSEFRRVASLDQNHDATEAA
jgi:hypothetical protein